MQTFDAIYSAVLESVIPAVVLGIVLVMAVWSAINFSRPLNAATRAILWTATLAALPLIQFIYAATHITALEPISRSAVHGSLLKAAPSTVPVKAGVLATPSTPVSPLPFPAARPFSVSLPPAFPIVALSIYAAITGLLLIRLFVSYFRLCLLRRATEPAPAVLAARLEHWLACCPTNRDVQLRVSSTVRSPLAIGWLKPIIVMPTALVLDLTQQELDNLGIHELAHVRRYDDWTNLLQRILQALFFFHPAAHYVARKAELEREIACDDWVIASASSIQSIQYSRSYARCLTKVVELRQYQRHSLLLSSGAFFGKGQLLKRIESLLDKTRNSATRVSSLTVLAAVVIFVAIVTEVAHLPAVIAFTQEERNATNIHWSDDSRDFSVNYRGEMTFSADDQSIASISPSGFLTIDESKNWSHRRIEVRPGAEGEPETKYFLDGRQKPLDGVGRAWAASCYLFLLRETGLNAEARVGRILSRRGPSGVFEELDLIHSDGVKRQYLNQLLDQAKLTTQDLQRVTDSARKISSDNDKAEFLLAHQREFVTPDLRTNYFRAVNSIQSDYDRRRVLTGMLAIDGHSPEIAKLVGLSAKSMNSDNDKAEVLLSIPAASSADAHCELLKAAVTIQSDNDKARVLHDAGYIESGECRDAYFKVVNLIQSDNDRAGVLQDLLSQHKLEADTYLNIAKSAKAINSDNDKANVLTLLGNHYTEPPLFEAANTIQSGNDLARVLQSVLDHKPAKPVLLAVIDSASRLAGDDEKAGILFAVAKQFPDAEVRSALQKACEKINSDNEYRRVASALFETQTGR